jgi:hypothetical protein
VVTEPFDCCGRVAGICMFVFAALDGFSYFLCNIVRPFLTVEVASSEFSNWCSGSFLVIVRPEKQAGLLAGLVLGFAVMFKPNLVFVGALLVISWLICRRYETLAFVALGSVFAAIISIISSSLFFNSWHCWFEWLRAVQSMPESIITREMETTVLPRSFQI